MRTLVLAAAVASSLTLAQARSVTSFDPVGKWTYSTLDDQGTAISGTMEIAGTPGAFTGTIGSATDPSPLTITDVFTAPSGMIVLADRPNNGGVAVIKVKQGPDGKLQASWGPLRGVIPATIARAK
jgi:hypothetical protein